jgi:hypothetical protein
MRRSRRSPIAIVATALALGAIFVPVAHTGNTSTAKVARAVPTHAGALSSLSSRSRAYVTAIMTLTPAALRAGAAGFGTGHFEGRTTRGAVMASLDPQSQRYVKAIMALTPAQLQAGAAGFGTGPATADDEASMIGSNWRSYWP